MLTALLCALLVACAIVVFTPLPKLYRSEAGMAGPVSFPFSSAVLTGATYLPLDGWQYEFAPFNGAVELIIRSTLVSATVQLTAGGDTIQESSPIQSGGTAGVTPSALNTPVVVGRVKKGDRIKVRVFNGNAATVTIDGIVTLVPGGRS